MRKVLPAYEVAATADSYIILSLSPEMACNILFFMRERERPHTETRCTRPGELSHAEDAESSGREEVQAELLLHGLLWARSVPIREITL